MNHRNRKRAEATTLAMDRRCIKELFGCFDTGTRRQKKRAQVRRNIHDALIARARPHMMSLPVRKARRAYAKRIRAAIDALVPPAHVFETVAKAFDDMTQVFAAFGDKLNDVIKRYPDVAEVLGAPVLATGSSERSPGTDPGRT